VNQVFQGQLDDLRVWNGVRSASEIQSNMLTRFTGAESGLIGLWDFEEGAGSTVTDRTASHYNGSFSSPAPTWTALPSNSVNLQGGVLAGAGTVHGNMTNGATVSPGGAGAAGTLSINGAYTQTAAGVLNVDLGGTTAGSQYDQLASTGAATLDGTLNVNLINGFSPPSGDSFTVVAAASRNGQFATENGLKVGTQVSLRANYTTSGLTLVSELPGIRVNPTFGVGTTESGGQASFTIVLDSAPSADVVISLTSSDTTEGVVSPASVTFTPANWNVPQTATITGVDDFLDDGDVAYTIVTGAAESTDSQYSGYDPSDVAVTNVDNDTAGVTVSPASGLATTEAGGQASFTVVLTSQPTANVTIGLVSSNLSEGHVSPTSVEFTSTNWQTPQTVVVTGVDDAVVDGNVAYSIFTGQAVSADSLYSQINPPDVSLTNTDDDLLDLQVANLA
ncbi:MAG TPA: hypothetical protein PLV92_24750, partial [Pirellulaceae bacterium]|nr:hypothetical protein [Pirellulaceae bacterium]